MPATERPVPVTSVFGGLGKGLDMGFGPSADLTAPAARRRPWATRRRLAGLVGVGLLGGLAANEWVVRPWLNPLRRSPEVIAAVLSARTPPAATRAEVEAWADAQGWPPGGQPYPLGEEPPVQRVVGDYWSFGFTVTVFAEWIFTRDGRAQDVRVWKATLDAP